MVRRLHRGEGHAALRRLLPSCPKRAARDGSAEASSTTNHQLAKWSSERPSPARSSPEKKIAAVSVIHNCAEANSLATPFPVASSYRRLRSVHPSTQSVKLMAEAA